VIVVRLPMDWSPATRAERVVAALDRALGYAIDGGVVIVDPARVRVVPAAKGA
jgi:hypothetical protein